MNFVVNFFVVLFALYAVSTKAALNYATIHASSVRKTGSVKSGVVFDEYPDISNTASAYTSSGTSIADYFSSEYVTYKSSDIPYYKHTVTECDMSYLENRPHKSSELVTIKIEEGDIIDFGEDIGFACRYSGGSCACVKKSNDVYKFYAGTCSSSGMTSSAWTGGALMICDDTDYGKGYWPPGPDCPSDQSNEVTASMKLTLKPRQNTQSDHTKRCYLPMGMQGMFVNGVQFFGWADGIDYLSKGYFHNIALVFEYYDFDICYGHATDTGVYHHHTYSPCLAELLGDQGLEHSPVYGFARDGFPIHGPWQNTTELAQSCWKTRNYDGVNTAAGGWGCMTSTTDTTNKGKRTCLLNDQFNPTSTTALSSANYGPATSASVVSQSGNSYTTTSGSYWEDFYFDSDCFAAGGAYLDENNGHDHDDYGWHYHLTVDSDGLPQFPFGIGPQYYGTLPAGQKEYCCSTVENAGLPSCDSTDTSESNYIYQTSTTPSITNTVGGPTYDEVTSYDNYETHSNPFCPASIEVKVTLDGFANKTLSTVQSNAIITAVASVTGVLSTDVSITSYTAYALNRRLTTSGFRRKLTTSWSIYFIINISANFAFKSLYTGTAASATTSSGLQTAITTSFATAISGTGLTTAIAAACTSTCVLPTLTIGENPSDDDGDDTSKFNPLILVAIAAIIPIGLIIYYCCCRSTNTEKTAATKNIEMATASPGNGNYATRNVNGGNPQQKNNRNNKATL
jgi:hypothetical protein